MLLSALCSSSTGNAKWRQAGLSPSGLSTASPKKVAGSKHLSSPQEKRNRRFFSLSFLSVRRKRQMWASFAVEQ